MAEKLIEVYVWLFARNIFEKWNKLLYRLSLGGLGILNYKTSTVSGERAFLKNYLLNKSGVVFDVGANKGDYSREVININPEINVYAFEPHPKTFKKLSENLSGTTNIKIINKGLSDASGVLALYDYLENDGSEHASLFADVITKIHGSNGVLSHDVELTTLDEFIEHEELPEISLLKIDTEGNELQVLKGSERALKAAKIKAIHFEFNEMNVASRCYFKDFWTLLENYKLYRLLPNEMLEIRRYSPLSCEVFAYQNIVAILKK